MSEINVLADDTVPLGGVYANMTNVWHTGLDFTLEFAVTLPAGLTDADAVSVARLKLPPAVAWNLAKAISSEVARFEEQFHKITPTPPE